MLALRLELLTGRYVASEFNDRNRAEWPPHPARVFSALVAAYHEAGKPRGGERALRWLEGLPPPQLCFSAAARRDVKPHFVPVNDKALGDAATVQNEWAKYRAANTDKARAKAKAKLDAAYAKSFAELPKLPKKLQEVVTHVLPASRTKQARTFPSVTPEDPVVHLVWDEQPASEIREGLERIAAAVVRLGHSSSLVAACWTEQAPAPTWVPASDGHECLRWVHAGQLDALEALHAAGPYAEQRVMPYAPAYYREARPLRPLHASCFAPHFLVLRRVAGPRVPIEAAELVAAAARRALISHAEEPVSALISGHTREGGPLQGDHLAVAALPYVGGAHGNGELLGLALMPPASLELDDLAPLHRAIARWEAAFGARGPDPRARLELGRHGVWTLERCLDRPPLHNLRERTWTGPAHSWASVTPMVLDRHPGVWRSDRERSVRRANATIRAACERIGLPPPAEIELSLSPFFRGSVPARQARRRAGKASDPRPCVHVRLSFEELVRGPVLLGAGRYHGLGLLRPLRSSEASDG